MPAAGVSAYARGVVLVGWQAPVAADGVAMAAAAAPQDLATRLGVRRIESLAPAVASGRAATAMAASVVPPPRVVPYRVTLREGEDVPAAVARLGTIPGVAYAEPDYVAHILASPGDPLYADQWALARIEAPAAWDLTTGSTTVPIAIIDSGIDAGHPDLAAQLWRNPGEVAGNGLDDDGNGYVDDLNGWNLLGGNADLSDTTGHGTEVAGVAAAAANNAAGGAGVCWGCRLMVVKVAQAGGTANYSDIAAGVLYAAAKGARVINISLGGSSDSVTLRSAIAQASQTATVIAGAGNGNTTTKVYPAAYDEYVVAVAGTGRTDAKVATSNFGSWVDIAAPGEELVTTFSGGTWGSTSGTSMAAPVVSGVAALLKSAHATWSGTSIRQQLLNTADNIDAANPGLVAGQLGAGRVNARKALTTSASPVLTVASATVNGTSGGAVKLGVTVPVVLTLRNAGIDAASVSGTLSSSDSAVTIVKGTGAFGAIAGGSTSANSADAFQVSIATGSGFGRAVPFTLSLVVDGVSRTLSLTLTSESTTLTLDALMRITGNTTWNNDRVYIANNVVVEQGGTLTIQPGTVVKFNAGKAMVVRGTLIARGTRQAPIVLTSAKETPQPGDWGGGGSAMMTGLTFEDSAVDVVLDGSLDYVSGSVLQHVTAEFGTGITVQNAKPLIADCVIRKMNGTALSSSQWGTPVGPGVPSAPTSPIYILRNRLVDNAWYGTLLSVTGAAVVRGNLFERNTGGVAVSTGSSDSPRIEFNTFVETGTGSTPTIMIQSPSVIVTGNTFVPKTGANYTLPGPIPDPIEISFSPGYWPTGISVDASANYWGTTNVAQIEARIRDGVDDLTNKGIVRFEPPLSEPSAFAPVIVKSLTLNPPSPVGIETVTFRAAFSGPMELAAEPHLAFQAPNFATPVSYLPSNSPLPAAFFRFVKLDSAGDVWAAGTGNGARHKLVTFREGTWQVLDYSASGMTDSPYGLAIDNRDRKWVVGAVDTKPVVAVFDGTTWQTISCGPQTFDCGKPLWFAAASASGPLFSLVQGGSVAGFDGLMTFHEGRWAKIGVPSGESWGYQCDLAADDQGGVWVSDNTHVRRYAAGIWTTFNYPSNERCITLAAGRGGAMWAAVGLSAVKVSATPPEVHPLPDYTPPFQTFNGIENIAVSGEDVALVAKGRLFRLRDGVWTNPAAVSLGIVPEERLALDNRGNVWIGVSYEGVLKFASDQMFELSGGVWRDERTFEAALDVTSRIPRGDYILTVSGARDALGFDTPAASTTFTVDYAGTITDAAPPTSPVMIAAGKTGNTGAVEARWAPPSTAGILNASVPASAAAPRSQGAYAVALASTAVVAQADSSVTGYRYAIGTAAGATDVVNWTATTSTSLSLEGLGLIPGQQYWLSLQARNAGGLWSASTISPFTAGEGFKANYLAEGATGPFFDLDIAIANPHAEAVSAFVTFLKEGGSTVVESYTLPPKSRITVRGDNVPGLDIGQVAASTVVESSRQLIVERTMFWNQAEYYGGHSGSAVSGPSRVWYFAEGHQGFFDTWLLLANASTTNANVTVKFLLEYGDPVVTTMPVGQQSRVTLFGGSYPQLINKSFSIVVESDVPIIAERAMYFGTNPDWKGGHESAGVPAPANRWFLAEGATGSFFDMWILVANPTGQPAVTTFTFLLGGANEGHTYTKTVTIDANSRFTLNPASLVGGDGFMLLNNAEVSTVVESATPIVVERAMYWPGGASTWTEAHNSFGVTETATRWGLAEGRIGGERGFDTYVLLANPDPVNIASVRLTFLRENGAAVTIVRDLKPTSRKNVVPLWEVPELASGERFGVVIESLPTASVPAGVPIAVERAMYWNAQGQVWAGGTNATAIKLLP